MDETQQGQRYEIRVRGRLEDRRADWFTGMALTYETATGETVLSGLIEDQSALHGLLARFRDLGIPIVSVVAVRPDPEPP